MQFFKHTQKVRFLEWLSKKPERVVRRFVLKTREWNKSESRAVQTDGRTEEGQGLAWKMGRKAI